MMNSDSVHITQILQRSTSKQHPDGFAVCWIKDQVDGVQIDDELYPHVSNSILFLDARYNWEIIKNNSSSSCGYVLYLSKEVLNSPVLSNLHINKVRLFSSDEIPLFKLSPGIEKRTQSILEMIDELLGSELNHRDEAILSLLNTFFVYCDGQCNIKSIASHSNTKSNIVYSFKQLVDEHVSKYHEVTDYAELLNISPKYLNECVKEVLSVGSKSIIIEQLLMRSRYSLKFSNKSIKEISFELGFSSPDYFSYFFKTHCGITPSVLRKS